MTKKARYSVVFALCVAWLWTPGLVGCKRNTQPTKKQAKRPKVAPQPRNIPRGSKVYPEEVVIQPGTFTMGSPDDEAGRLKVEGPQHRVKLVRVFVMWRHEATQDDFRRVMGYSPAKFKNCGGVCPVDNVNWHEAAAFCNRLSKKRNLPTCFRCEGKGRHSICQAAPEYKGKNYYRCPGYRLPTEAEWEYAARAGSDGIFYKPVGQKKSRLQTVLDRIAWNGQNSFVTYQKAHSCATKPIENNLLKKSLPGVDPDSVQNLAKRQAPPKNVDKNRCGPKPVGQKQPNQFGLYDMLGNVSEWVYDGFSRYPSDPQKDPVGKEQGHRIFRGCNWFQMPRECRLARRFWVSPGIRNLTTGFRPARTLGIRAGSN